MTEPIRVLIACEFTGTVRNAFNTRPEFLAFSCDLRPDETSSNMHYQCDVRDILDDGWDMLIVAHPPCTRLCNSGVRWLNKAPPGRTLDEMWAELDEGCALFSDLWNAPVPHVAVENPVMHRHAKERITNYEPFSQSVQPWEYGDFETKRTCLWTRGLLNLVPLYRSTSDAALAAGLPADTKPVARVHSMPPGPQRDRERSRFFPGIARAMAQQWGDHVLSSRIGVAA